MQDGKDRIYFKYCFKCDRLYKYNQVHCPDCGIEGILFRQSIRESTANAISLSLNNSYVNLPKYLNRELERIKVKDLVLPTQLVDVELFFCVCKQCGNIYFGVVIKGDEPTYEEKCDLCDSFNYPQAISTLYFKFLYIVDLGLYTGVADGSMLWKGTLLNLLLNRAMEVGVVRVFESVYKIPYSERMKLYELRRKQLVEKKIEKIRSDKAKVRKKIAEGIVSKILK